jgi:hypothetical protein
MVYVAPVSNNYKYFKLSDAVAPDDEVTFYTGYLKNNENGNDRVNAFAYNGSERVYNQIGKTINKYDYNDSSEVYEYAGSFEKKAARTTQGIDYNNGRIIVIRFNKVEKSLYKKNISNATNILDIYDDSGKYYGSYTIYSQEELEGVAYNPNENKYALYFNSSGNIYEVKLDIP